MGNVRAPGLGVRRPSAMVSGSWNLHALAGAQGKERVVAVLRLDAEDADARAKRVRGDRTARDQPAATDGNHQRVQIGNLFEQFQRGRALTGDGPGMIEGRHDGGAGFLGDTAANGFAVLRGAVIRDDSGAVAASGLHLQLRRVGRHHDRRRNAQRFCRNRDGLPVISGRKRHYAARRFHPWEWSR